MSVQLGNTAFSKAYLGLNSVDKIALGSNVMYSASTDSFNVKGRVRGNASFAIFSNGARIEDNFPDVYYLITTVEAGGNVNLTYTSQNEFDEFRIDSGTVGSFNVGETNFQLTNVQSDIECEIERTD
jgi:hypothetical protein